PEVVKAQFKLQRVDWQTVRLQGASRSVRFHNEAVLTNLLEQEIEVRPVAMPDQAGEEIKGQALAGLAPTVAGQYLVEVKAKDSGGREVASSLSFNVSAPAKLAWDYRNDVQLTLKPDQTDYAPGQTAEIL